jgi:hypothetical protein
MMVVEVSGKRLEVKGEIVGSYNRGMGTPPDLVFLPYQYFPLASRAGCVWSDAWGTICLEWSPILCITIGKAPLAS